jgi:hypothetical protein
MKALALALALAPALALALACGCAPSLDGDAIDDVELATPSALTSCASPPAFVARLWVSGNSDPCPLTVAGAKTSGACAAAAGRVRTFTLDWFIHDDAHDVDLVLAQAQKKLDLTAPSSANATLAIADADIESDACLDMRADQVTGSPTELVAGQVVPVCDVDNSCAGAAASAPCHNLDEVCGGGDPFNPAVDP